MIIRYVLFFLYMFLFKAIAQNSFSSCEVFVRQQEKFYHIPMHLLKAISLIESGRIIKSGQRVAWPWTINVGGKGYAFESKDAAIKAVRKFQRHGETNIDVGCMQINLRYHPIAFRDLESAFDPQLNIAYAAQFLNSLKRQLGNWRAAVAHYHSASPKFHQPYCEKIHKQWEILRNFSGNITPVVHDVGYVTNSVAFRLLQPTALAHIVQRMAPQLNVNQQGLAPVPILLPGKILPINGHIAKPEPYARLKYRKFYHALP